MATPYRILIGREDVTALVDDGWTFTNGDPGGHLTASMSFPRLVDVRRGEKVRFEIGLEPAWEGRVAEVAPGLAGNPQTAVGCEGIGVLLQEPVADIYVDQMLSTWTGMWAAGRQALLEQGFSPVDARLSTGGDTPGLLMEVTGTWEFESSPVAITYYRAGDRASISEIYYAWRKGVNVNHADPNWGWELNLYAVDGSSVSTGDLRAAGPSSGTVMTAKPAYSANFEFFYRTGPGGTANLSYDVLATCLAIFGRHGLTKRGVATLTQPQGFYPQDIAVHAMKATGANFDTSLVEESTAYIVRQAAYREPVPGEDIVAEQAKVAGGWHYGTWAAPMLGGRPRFAFRSLPTGPTAVVTRRDCEALNPVERLADLYDRALVSYQDPVDGERVVEVERPNAEMTRLGISGKTMTANAGTASTADAYTYGLFQLAIAELKARAAGNVTLLEDVSLPDGGSKPAGLLRPGIDLLRITDLPDTPLLEGSADYQLKQTTVTGGRDGIKTDIQLGTGADYAEVLQARLDAATEQALNGR
jgi:hypothetical protein